MNIEQQTYYNYLLKRNWLSFWVRHFFVKDIARHFHGHVLDVGCGIGEFLGLYKNSLGIDINPLLAKHCQQQNFMSCVSGAYPLPFANASFDGVLASNILEHLDSAETAVAEASRVLKSGGILVITVPQEAGFKHDATHVRLLKQPDLAQIGKNFSLRQTFSYYYPFHMEWPGKLFYFCELRAVFMKV